MKQARRFLGWGLCCVVVWMTVSAAIGIIAVEGALHPGRRTLGAGDEAQAREAAGRSHATLTEVAIPASDGVELRGWIIRPDTSNGDAVILLHGQADDRAGMLGNAELLLAHGYMVLLPDARAHGESGGDLATYGVREADDVRRWYEWLHQSKSPGCIDGLGESMGAAELLQSLAAEPGFCAVVAESSFASFREASYDRLGQELHSGQWVGRTLLRPAVEAGFVSARWRYGVDLEQASPEAAVAASRVPVLLIHGLADTNLPPRHAERIVARSASRIPAIELWEPARAGHCGAAGAEPAEYNRRVIGWFGSHLTSGPSPGRSVGGG